MGKKIQDKRQVDKIKLDRETKKDLKDLKELLKRYK